MLRTWNVSLICATFALSLLGTFLVRSGVLQSIHAFGESKVGPAAARPDRGDRDRDDDPDRQPARLAALRAPPRLALQPRVGLPGQQPAARRPRRGGRLGDVLPADLRGGDRAGVLARRALVQPLRDAAGDRARLLHGRSGRWSPGGGSPWRACATPSASRSRRPPRPRSPSRSGSGWRRARPPTRCSSSARSRSSRSRRSSSAASARAERSRAAAGSRRSARSLTRNRRRYGGYVVHVGLVLALFGIAASSSFQTSRDLRLSPGDSAEVGDYTVTYERPTSDARSVPATSRSSSSGPCSTSPATASTSTTLHPLPRVLRRHRRRPGGADPQLLRGRADERGRSPGGPRPATSGARCSPT